MERRPIIHKDPSARRRPAVLADYEAARASFSWAEARALLDGLPAGGLNIAYEAVDRHLATFPERCAVRWIGKDGAIRDHSYADLAAETSRFANLLRSAGIAPGDRVFLLLGRVVPLVVAALGTLKARSVVCPLFSAFGPEPVKARMQIGSGRVLVTTPALYRKKIAGIRGELPTLELVLLVSEDGAEIPEADLPPGCRCLARALAAASDRFDIEPTDPEEMALLHFTSGTTGRPKGAVHVHEAVVHHAASGRYALDLQPGDVYWCTADPGWVTGTSYGIVSPLVNGVTMVFYEGEFDAASWYRILEEQRVCVWYTAPTAVRMLMRAGTGAAPGAALPDLRFVASVGEPLSPDGVTWGIEAFGQPIHDNWWQTETGGIMIANFAATDIRPGSMGRPLPGIDAEVVRRDADGTVTPIPEPDTEGEIALVAGWPSMMRGYLGEAERYAKCFAEGTDGRRYYLSGDLAKRDEDGFFWFVGRADDVIKTSGHLIGPFEVESALLEHPAVAEAAVIGKPDEMAMEIVKAFVALKPGQTADEATRRSILGHARKRLGAVVAPKEIDFVASLPKTRSGKILRRLLKARELGLPEGDTSTLESDAPNGRPR